MGIERIIKAWSAVDTHAKWCGFYPVGMSRVAGTRRLIAERSAWGFEDLDVFAGEFSRRAEGMAVSPRRPLVGGFT